MPRGAKPGERRGGRKRGTLNKATADVKALAEVYSAEAIQTLAGVMKNTKADVRARIAAANALLDRAHGKPAQAITGADGGALEMQPVKVVQPHAVSADGDAVGRWANLKNLKNNQFWRTVGPNP